MGKIANKNICIWKMYIKYEHKLFTINFLNIKTAQTSKITGDYENDLMNGINQYYEWKNKKLSNRNFKFCENWKLGDY